MVDKVVIFGWIVIFQKKDHEQMEIFASYD